MPLSERFIQHWTEKFAATAGKRPVLLAVSGGIDSMVMAHLFLRTAIPFAVAHCNFSLRGTASDKDELFVREWCSQHQIHFYHKRFDTLQEAERLKKSIQETARILRYDWFEQLRAAHAFSCIATAHHADDNAETMLINLCRGTGIAGLHGIPERSHHVIRPLLFVTRKEVEVYAATVQLTWREDESNSKDDYLRNALRHRVLPVLDQLIPGVAMRILNTSRTIGEAEQLYQQAIMTKRKQLLEQRGKDYYVPVKLLSRYTPLYTICYELFRPFGFSAAQAATIPDLLQAESGRYISSATHRIIRNRDFLVVTALQTEQADLILIQELPAVIETGDQTFHCTVKERPEQLDQAPNVLLADMDKLTFPLVLRRKKTGDYLYPIGMGMKKKKVSRLLIDQKVALHDKEHIWILESGKRIVWVAGIRADERFKITDRTQRVLRITLR